MTVERVWKQIKLIRLESGLVQLIGLFISRHIFLFLNKVVKSQKRYIYTVV